MVSEGRSEGEIDNEVKLRRMRPVDEELQYASALNDVVSEMDGQSLAGIHPVYYTRIGQMAERGAEILKAANTAREQGKLQEAESLTIKGNALQAPAKELGKFFERLARSGGQYQLSTIMGASDTEAQLDLALKHAGTGTLEEIIARGGQPLSSAGQSDAHSPVSEAASQKTYYQPSQSGTSNVLAPDSAASVRNVPSGGGQILYEHEPRAVKVNPGETISPGGVVLSPSAMNEISGQLTQMRKELRGLKKLGVRTQEQQKRMEQIQQSHPEWISEDEDEGSSPQS